MALMQESTNKTTAFISCQPEYCRLYTTDKVT